MDMMIWTKNSNRRQEWYGAFDLRSIWKDNRRNDELDDLGHDDFEIDHSWLWTVSCNGRRPVFPRDNGRRGNTDAGEDS